MMRRVTMAIRKAAMAVQVIANQKNNAAMVMWTARLAKSVTMVMR